MNVYFTLRARWTFPILLIFILAFTLAACGSKAAGPTEVHVKLTEYKVEIDKTSIPAGPVKFMIQNSGTITHELVLEPAGAHDEPFEVNDKESEAEDIGPGQTVDLEWIIDSAGQYQLACYTPGHFEQGMTTTFTVTSP